MDTLRGSFPDDSTGAEDRDFGWAEDEPVRELPPEAIGQDERRMQVRAYNLWASLLEDRNFPSIDDLEPGSLPGISANSVFLDFTAGIENPKVRYIGEALAAECGDNPAEIQYLSDVPSRSLLSRITDHYMQIIANQAPIGFEAEFVNNSGKLILYRGILLPFSNDGETIDYICGVINWKELADQQTTDELLLEIGQALDAMPDTPRSREPMSEWADGPSENGGILDLTGPMEEPEVGSGWPSPEFAQTGELDLSAFPSADLPLDNAASAEMGLADWLASARELALAAKGSEDRSRSALYAAISRAHDFALAAETEPEAFAEIAADAGLTVQDRAPLTPVVKLVFGADYDKTRLAEYAAALGHARRRQVPRGQLAGYLADAAGGLKGIVTEERRLRREESGKPAVVRDAPRKTLMRKLRKLEHCPIAETPAEGDEFALLVARRLPNGEVVLLGEVSGDVPLFEKAARKLLA
ncbi:MAG: hypothetical protein AB7F98_00605 [Novosphingobium sp.]